MLIYDKDGKVSGFDGDKDFVHFSYLSEHKQLSSSFIEEWIDYLDPILICTNQELNDYLIELIRRKYPNQLKSLFILISRYQDVSPEIAEKYFHLIDFSQMSYNDKLSPEFWNSEFIEKHYSSFEEYMTQFIQHSRIPEGFIEKHLMNKIRRVAICQWYTLSEDFFRRHKEEIPWGMLTNFERFSEEFIREFKDKIRFDRNQINFVDRSHEFIREFQDYITTYWWDIIAESYPLTKDFVIEFKHEMKLHILVKNPAFELDMLGLKEEEITRDFLDYKIGYLNLKEKDVEKYSHLINWEAISFLDNFSVEFKQKHNL